MGPRHQQLRERAWLLVRQRGRERIGLWDRHGRFTTYFTEGTPEFPTVSNRLHFNESNLIVITFSLNDPTSYLVPRPGERLDLVNLVDNLPPGPSPLFVVNGLNDNADMFGFGSGGDFLLKRIDDSCHWPLQQMRGAEAITSPVTAGAASPPSPSIGRPRSPR